MKNKNMKIIICGSSGKMGKAVALAAQKSNNCTIAAGVDIIQDKSCKFSVFSNIQDINLKADAIIDFSHPSNLDAILDYAQKTKTPAVICTTGLSNNQIESIKNASDNVAIFYSRNMSLGINLILELSRTATKILGDTFDVEIIEKHHNQKIDAPSGTALMIAEEISDSMKSSTQYVYDRTGVRKPREKGEIGIHSVRGGSIPGDHEIMFAGKDEIITLSHHAGSRDIFATGAVKAAEFVAVQTPGLYTMRDMIKNS